MPLLSVGFADFFLQNNHILFGLAKTGGTHFHCGI